MIPKGGNYTRTCSVRKEEAIRQNQPTFVGERCRCGHGNIRYVKNNRCVDCYYESGVVKDWGRRKKSLISQLKRMAKYQNKGREFNIGVEDVEWVTICPILNIPINYYSIGGRKSDTASFDRVDTTKGYVKGNVRIISNRANMIKSDLTLEQIIRLVKYVQN